MLLVRNLRTAKSWFALCCIFSCFMLQMIHCSIFFTRGSSFGYLAAVAMPLDLSNRDVYVSFNFEANYGLPSNDSYNEWIDRWDLDENFLGINSDITAINGRHLQQQQQKQQRRQRQQQQHNQQPLLYTRNAFYRTFMGYLEHFQMNGTACLLRTICEVSASTLHENNGLLGSIFKILFMPTSSKAEKESEITNNLYEAEYQGAENGDCIRYTQWCPEGIIDMISSWI